MNNNPYLAWAAQTLVDSIQYGQSGDTIARNMQQFVEALGGQAHILETLPPEGRLLYVIALVAAQP